MCRHIWACVSRIICGFEARGRIRPIDRAKLRRLSWTFSICVHPCVSVFNCVVRCAVGEACGAWSPEDSKHRYTQMNPDKHRWDSAVAEAWVQIEPLQHAPPFIASEAKQFPSKEVWGLLRRPRDGKNGHWGIGFECGSFPGNPVTDILTSSLLSFRCRRPCR
jgi:hypothetical protein